MGDEVWVSVLVNNWEVGLNQARYLSACRISLYVYLPDSLMRYCCQRSSSACRDTCSELYVVMFTSVFWTLYLIL
jgi:hypothetical protein